MNFDQYLIEGFLYRLSRSAGIDKVLSYINICKLFEEVSQRYLSGYKYNSRQGTYEKTADSVEIEGDLPDTIDQAFFETLYKFFPYLAGIEKFDMDRGTIMSALYIPDWNLPLHINDEDPIIRTIVVNRLKNFTEKDLLGFKEFRDDHSPLTYVPIDQNDPQFNDCKDYIGKINKELKLHTKKLHAFHAGTFTNPFSKESIVIQDRLIAAFAHDIQSMVENAQYKGIEIPEKTFNYMREYLRIKAPEVYKVLID